MQIDMQGRTAIITGGSKGLGLAIASRMAGYGAHVVIAARNRAGLEKAEQAICATGAGRVTAVTCDVSTAAGITALHEQACAAAGSATIDIVVNNAGVSAAKPFLDSSDEAWQADLDLKLFAAIRLNRLVWPAMKAQRWGRIIQVLNTHAKAPAAASMPTSVSRAAGMALTKALSAEGAPDNILVNALLVGRIESDQWVRRAEASGQPLEAVLTNLGRGIPMGRVGTADEFASVACFLASELGSYVTGTAINVDGGLCPVV